jgi:hypothetical protein
MLDTILGALLPMVVTFLLGFAAAWRHDFEPKDASILNRMVLRCAVFDRCFGFVNGEGNFVTPRIFDQLTGLMVTIDEKRIYESAAKGSTCRYRRAAASNPELVVVPRSR